MRAILDFVSRHHEAVSRSEFRVLAIIGITLALMTVSLFAYDRLARPEEAVAPAWWQQPDAGGSSPRFC